MRSWPWDKRERQTLKISNVCGRISMAIGSEMSLSNQQKCLHWHSISKLFDILSLKMHLGIKFTTHNYVSRLDFILFLAIEVKAKVWIKNIFCFFQISLHMGLNFAFFGHAGYDNCSTLIPHKLMLMLTCISWLRLKWLIDRGNEWLSN